MALKVARCLTIILSMPYRWSFKQSCFLNWWGEVWICCNYCFHVFSFPQDALSSPQIWLNDIPVPGRAEQTGWACWELRSGAGDTRWRTVKMRLQGRCSQVLRRLNISHWADRGLWYSRPSESYSFLDVHISHAQWPSSFQSRARKVSVRAGAGVYAEGGRGRSSQTQPMRRN